MLKEMEGKQGKYAGWSVIPMSGGSTKLSNKPQKSVSFNNDDRDLHIKWGMCLKEAVNLSIAIGANEEKPNYLQSINYLTFKLMEIAVDGFEEWEKEQHEKEQNSNPNDDDLPF